MCKQVKKERKMFSFFRRSLLMTLYSPFGQQFYLKKSCEFYISPYLHDLRKNGKVGNAWDVKVN